MAHDNEALTSTVIEWCRPELAGGQVKGVASGKSAARAAVDLGRSRLAVLAAVAGL
jgi:hypothetical protein